MKTRQIFEQIRGRKKKHFTLRVRMVIWVQIELLASIGLAYLIDCIAHILNSNWNVPLLLELIIVSVIVGGVITSFISKAFFNPIENLRQAINQVADGDFSIQMDTDKSSLGEIQELYAGFNLMVKELASTEILQTDFVSNVSHEFKTPINAIEGYTTLLQGCENLEPEQQEYIEKILFNTRRISSLASNILLLSRIENQNIQSNQNRFCLDEQIRKAVLSLESAWTAKNLWLDIDMDNINFVSNESLLNHVWTNLIANAIKFSPDGGTIQMQLKDKKNAYIFTIEDNGPGLSEEAQKHLFDKFYQADTSHKQEGNGLGLALVKRILTIVDGEIHAENVDGGGCCFTVKLPAKQK